MARRHKSRLLGPLTVGTAPLLAAQVIQRYKTVFSEKGNTWAQNYLTNIQNKYLNNNYKLQAAQDRLEAWYTALAENKSEIRRAYERIKQRYDEIQAGKVVSSVGTAPTRVVTAQG